MKKNNFSLIVFLVLGLLGGTIAGQLLSGVEWLSFLGKSTQIEWAPRADLQIVKYDLHFWIKLNAASILGIAAAIWIYRKL